MSINRIRLEFKEGSAMEQEEATSVLIESDWNLKWVFIVGEHVVLFVLIESDWNLKTLPPAD